MSEPGHLHHVGNDVITEKLATEYAYNISAGHSLVILLKNAFPINI